MLQRETIPVHSVNNTQHIHKFCGHNVEFLGTFEKLRKAIKIYYFPLPEK
jgi:hypothetical protein